jgi:N-formylglutamate deformylase
MKLPAFDLERPDRLRSGVVFASPHSGAYYPDSFKNKTILADDQIRSSEDAFVDELYSAAPACGVPLLKARMPRAYVDLNRSCDELDPALIEGVKKQGHNPRVASGLGVIPRVVANGRAIYRGKLPLSEAHWRIETYWRPYHQALSDLLAEARAAFGQAILVDCHSMPHEAIEAASGRSGAKPDVVLGDRFGASAAAEVVEHIESAFRRAGLRVVRNSPFAGAYITQAYGRPSRRQHAVQVEINRSLYMDERRVVRNGNFEAIREILNGVTDEIAGYGADRLPCAAE